MVIERTRVAERFTALRNEERARNDMRKDDCRRETVFGFSGCALFDLTALAKQHYVIRVMVQG